MFQFCVVFLDVGLSSSKGSLRIDGPRSNNKKGLKLYIT